MPLVKELYAELERREKVVNEGICDYCGRPGNTERCKFSERHLKASHQFSRIKRAEAGIAESGTYVGGLHRYTSADLVKRVKKCL